MKLQNAFLLVALTITSIGVNAQLKVKSNGHVIIGPDTTWSDYNLMITGSGTSGSLGLLGFGDNSNATHNVLVGEYGTTDSDTLLLHGDNGIVFSTNESITPRMFLKGNGNIGIGSAASNPSGLFCVGTNGSTYASGFFKESTVNASGYRGLQVNKSTDGASAGTHLYGITSYADAGSGGYKMFAVYGSAYRGSTPTNARSYGVLGTAGNGISGYNYGVYGTLQGSRNGAAIYGTDSYSDVGVNGMYAGYFEGDVHITGDLTVSGSYPGSDIRLKKDVRNLDSDVISKLTQLQAIKFKLKHPSEIEGAEKSDTADMKKIADELKADKYTRDRIGLIAQELQTTFPEVIKTDNSGFLWVNYDGMVPVLVEAIKEQQNMIKELQEQIIQLQPDSLWNKSGISSAIGNFNSLNSTSELFQNNPNPFNTDTEIKFRIPEKVHNSVINIYDLQGKQIRSFKIFERGEASIIIYAGEFNPGIYLYTLISDGKEIGTKRMILTEN